MWKQIKGYPYEVSTEGQVRRIGASKNLAQTTTKTGYKRLNLCKDGVKIRFSVHRLVAEAFIPNPEGLPEVNHKDEIKSNNRLSNLHWCTRQFNVEYSHAKLYSLKNAEGVIHNVYNLAKFCREHDLQQPSLSRVVNGTNSHHKGWTKYEQSTSSATQ